MNRSDIDKLLSEANYSEAFENLAERPPSIWRDTSELLCLSALGNSQQALRLANRLYRSELERHDARLNDPELSAQLRHIALVFAEQGEPKKACNILRALCLKTPGSAALRREYAFALSNNTQLGNAEHELVIAIQLEPDNAQTYMQLARLYCQTGRVDAGINSYYMAATLEPGSPDILQRIAFWSNYSNLTNQQLSYQVTRLWAHKAHPRQPRNHKIWHTDDPERRLQIAFISGNLYAHALSFYIQPLLKSLDRAHFRVTAYSDTRHSDKVTLAIKSKVDVWRESLKQTNTELAAQIGMDQIDVLIDLSGLAASSRIGVFAKRPAPLQLSWLGYPSTTGLKSIAYRITDQIADPDGRADLYFSEKNIRLENGFICYQPPVSAPDIRKRPDNRPIVFGSFNDLAKISSLTLDLWASALHAVPNSGLYLKHHELKDSCATDYLQQEFRDRGIEEHRLRFRGSNPKIEEHLHEYNRIDIALDTTPYNGTTTTLEALWMGVPVVSLSGDTHASRVSASILHRVGLGRYAVTTFNAFSAHVTELANDVNLRKLLRSSLRAKMRQSALMNNRQFADEFGAAIREQWRALCKQMNTEVNLRRGASQPADNPAVDVISHD